MIGGVVLSNVAAEPLSREKIRAFANVIRRFAVSDNRFDINRFLEHVLSTLDPAYEFYIVFDDELSDAYAKTIPDYGVMTIRESTYEGSARNNPRDRFTLCHELGHYLLHRAKNISYMRSDRELKKFMDPEWQANTFAAELLVPEEVAKNFSVPEIARICGVSYSVAQIQKNQFSGQKNKATRRHKSLATFA